MAEDKNFLQRASEYLNRPSEASLRKMANYNQSLSSSRDTSIYGYNTGAGFWETSSLKEIGDGTSNSAVVACLNVLSTSFSEPQLQVVKRDQIFGDREVDYKHPVAELYRRPNEFMSSSLLSHYIVVSLNAHGDAFIFKNRNQNGKVVQLVPLMPNLVEVRGNTEKLITHYEYYAHSKNELAGEPVKIDPKDVIHIRQGIDSNDHRRGHAPLKSILRELIGDEAAGQYSSALLTNLAVPGVVLSPRNDAMGGPTREEAEAIASSYKQKFGGANRGQPMVLSGAMSVEVVSFSPDQMKLQELRRLPEERVSAVLGVPAILAGLGAGLDSATYNNTAELREFFTEQKLVPLWKTVANELTHQLLLPDFGGDDVMCEYDVNNVRALQTDMDNLYNRVNKGVSGGWITIGEARKVVGLEVDEKHNVYLRPLNMLQVPADGSDPAPMTEEQDEGSDNNPRAGQLQAASDNEASYEAKLLRKLYDAKMDSVDAVPETTRQAVSPKPSRNMFMFTTREAAEERAEQLGCEGSHTHKIEEMTYYMPCSSHEAFERTKKSFIDGIVEELKVSTEEAEVVMEQVFEMEPENIKEKPKKDRTNFPSPGDDMAVRISNSKYKMFPYGYAKSLKEDYPEIWRRGGNGGNPPTSFTGNDAYNRWSKYQSGDRSESVLNWVRRRERFMGRHQNNNRLAGVVAAIKWGGVLNMGVPAMKKVISDQKKVVRSRRKEAYELASKIADENAAKAVSARIRKTLTNKVEEHNSKNPKHRATLRMLIAVFNRGVGAYRTNPGSVRGNVSGPDQWAVARVNGFLHALRTGRFKRKPYDQDLLPSSHPLSSKKGNDEMKASFVRIGQSVSWSINKDPDPPSTVHGVVTSVNGKDKEATMLVWAINEDGSHKKTDRKVTMPISKLTVIKDITK
nr:phage portal protein [uncultured Mediterranean phage uvMED]